MLFLISSALYKMIRAFWGTLMTLDTFVYKVWPTWRQNCYCYTKGSLYVAFSPVGSHQVWDTDSLSFRGDFIKKRRSWSCSKPLLPIIFPITALWTTDFANETSTNFNRHHWPSVVLQMAARGVVQLTSYHPPLVPLSMATHPRCTLSSASMNPQLV